jgi:zinc protease
VYRKGNIIISIVGNIEKEKFLDILAKNIKKYRLNDGKVTVKHIPVQLKSSKTIVKKKKGLNLSAMIIGFKVCDTYNEDKFALSFIDGFLSGMSGILFKKIREEHALAYEVSSFANFGLDVGALYIYARIDKKEESKVKKLIEKILQDIKTEGLTRQELLQFKNEISGTVLRQVQRNSAKSRDYALYSLYNLGLDYTQKYLNTIEKLTNDDIIRVANKYLNLDKAVFSIVHPV